MANYYRRRSSQFGSGSHPPLSGAASFISGLSDSFVKDQSEKNKYRAQEQLEEEKSSNRFTNDFVMQTMRGQASFQKQQTHDDAMIEERKAHDKEMDGERAKTRQAQKELIKLKQKAKWPTMGEQAMLAHGGVPAANRAKFGMSKSEGQMFVKNIAQKYGWEPSQVPDYETADSGFMGIGSHAPTQTKTIYQPPKDNESEPSLEDDSESSNNG